MAGGARALTVVSTDLFYDPRPDVIDGWRAEGARAVEMEAATILQLAERRGVEAACVLGVTDVPGDAGGAARRAAPEEHRGDRAAGGRGGLRGLGGARTR